MITSLDGASIQDVISRIAGKRKSPICSSMEIASDVLVGNERWKRPLMNRHKVPGIGDRNGCEPWSN